jgi:hypothetical protein
MEEVRFAQDQQEFKQKDEAFNMNKRATALQMQGQEYQNVVFRNKATQTALQTAWETDNEEAMTKFMMLAYKMTSGNLYEDPTLQNEMSSTLSGNPRLLQNEQMKGLFEMVTDGQAGLREQSSEEDRERSKSEGAPGGCSVCSIHGTAEGYCSRPEC